MKEFSLIIDQELHQKTVRHILLKVMKISSSAFSSLKFSGGVLLDGKQAYANDRVQAGQQIQIRFPDKRVAVQKLPAHAMKINIVYEDDDYYILEKPAGLPTMYSQKQGGPTLETGLYHFLGCPENYVFRPVNRLDKGTGGLMAVAKHAHAQQLLQKALHTDRFIRNYIALCHGTLPVKEGTICAPIGKDNTGIKRKVMPEGKEAKTDYLVLKTSSKYSLVHLRLHTGRTHQIRVHMAYMNCPIVGDYVYGKEDGRFPGRFALHSSEMEFVQPLSGNVICAVSKIPDLWYDILENEQ